MRAGHRSHISGRRWAKKAGTRKMDNHLAERAEKLEKEVKYKQQHGRRQDLSKTQLQERQKRKQNRRR